MSASAILLPPTTPPSYHRIVSPTLKVSTDPTIPIPVGLLACQRDPLLTELPTTVITAIISQPHPAPSGKKSKKAVFAPILPADPLLEIIFQDTVIFPEGGGQPTDIGLVTTADGNTWEVAQVKRFGAHAVHFVRVKNNVDEALRAFSPGAKVIVALGQDGFNRRYDHMTMHTSQHMLSALLETHFNLPTLSWSLTAYPAPSYVEIPRGMTPDEITAIQDKANRLVFEGRQIHVEVEELNRGQETDVPKLESGRSVGRGLPDDYTGGVKRVVVIDGVDRNPCCGTHLPSLHNLQIFLLPQTDALSRSSTTSARLYFLCGPRLIAHLTSTHAFLTNAASTLSCGAPQVPERVGQVIDERRKAEKRVEDVEAELATFVAGSLVRDMGVGDGQVFKRHVHRTDDSGTALGFLSAVSSAFVTATATSAVQMGYVLVLSSSPSSQNATSTSIVLVFGSDDKKVKAVGDGLKEKLGVKGGGKGLKWSGKFVGVWKESRENVLVSEVLASA